MNLFDIKKENKKERKEKDETDEDIDNEEIECWTLNTNKIGILELCLLNRNNLVILNKLI